MKTLYTSYFAKNATNPLAIAVASPPKWYSGKWIQQISPQWDILLKLERGDITAVEYYQAYVHYLDNNVNAQEVIDSIPDGSILLGYEVPIPTSDRHVLADWLMEGAEVVIIEWTPPPSKQEQFVEGVLEF